MGHISSYPFTIVILLNSKDALALSEYMKTFEYIKALPDRIRSTTWEDVRIGGRKLIRETAKSVCDSTALLAIASPIQAFADTVLLENIGKASDALGITFWNMSNLTAMTNERSFNGKIGVAAITYCGIGWAYGRLRQVSRKAFGINDKSKEYIQGIHDWVFTALYSSGVLIGGYTYANEHDWQKIGFALGLSAATQIVRGPLIGYAVDCYEDLLGFKECGRVTYPQAIKNLGKKAKLGVAALGVAASVGLIATIYSLTPSDWSNNPNRLAERKQARAQAHYQAPSQLQSLPFSTSQPSNLERIVK